MKKITYCGVVCGLLAVALTYPCQPISWLGSAIFMCASAYLLSKADANLSGK